MFVDSDKMCKMNDALCEVLNDTSLVSFIPLNIEDGEV